MKAFFWLVIFWPALVLAEANIAQEYPQSDGGVLTVIFHGLTRQILQIRHSEIPGVLLEATSVDTGIFYQWLDCPSTPGAPLIPVDVPVQRAELGGICLHALVTNRSPSAITGFRFPHFRGLRAFPTWNGGGPGETQLRTGLGVINPFHGAVTYVKEYAGGIYQRFGLRWLDFGNHRAGLSAYERSWGLEESYGSPPVARATLVVERPGAGPDSVNLGWRHHFSLAPEVPWESRWYILTFHHGGWARGIESFRNYVSLVHSPSRIVPHVREGLGFQTVWMTEGLESTLKPKLNFSYNDLPTIARAAKLSGIQEVVLFGAVRYQCLPIPFDCRLGTREDLIRNVVEARTPWRSHSADRLQDSVNFSIFFNVQAIPANRPNCLADPALWCNPTEGIRANLGKGFFPPFDPAQWVYHSEMVPGIIPSLVIPARDQPVQHQRTRREVTPEAPYDYETDVLTALNRSLREWSDAGVRSFAMDVTADDGTHELANAIRAFRHPASSPTPPDVEATFSGEPVSDLERMGGVLDYTWSWTDHLEAEAFVSVMNYPRLSVNVSTPRGVMMALVDNLYMNVMLRKGGGANGSARIDESPEVASTLQTASRIREAFLPYFTLGTFVGDSILLSPVEPFLREGKENWIGGATIDLGDPELPGVMVRGYRHAGRLLVLVLNNTDLNRNVQFTSYLPHWLPLADKYLVKRYHAIGAPPTVSEVGHHWSQYIAAIPKLQVAIFEVMGK